MDIHTMPAAQAVETLITDYGKLVFHVILGLTSDWQESQDLTQDTFVQALRAIDAARSARGAHFHAKAWLLQIAVNNVRMYRRRRSIMCVVPFSFLREAAQEETAVERVGDPVIACDGSSGSMTRWRGSAVQREEGHSTGRAFSARGRALPSGRVLCGGVCSASDPLPGCLLPRV